MLYRSDKPDSRRQFEAASEALPKGWRLDAIAVDKSDSVAAAIDKLMQRRVDIVWTSADTAIYDTPAVRSLLLSAMRSKTPVFGFSPAFARAGAVIGIGIDPASQGAQAAALTIKVLQQATSARSSPGTIEPPSQFQIILNAVAAQQLGIELPDSVIQKASQVFKDNR